jgi:tRNA 2-thiouridine synthesizing protein A
MLLDNRGLEPPQPMIRTLAVLEDLDRGQTLVIINDRRPMFLFEQLDERGYLYLTEQQEDGSYKVTISRKAG